MPNAAVYSAMYSSFNAVDNKIDADIKLLMLAEWSELKTIMRRKENQFSYLY